MDSLQAGFGGEIQILPITYQQGEEVARSLERLSVKQGGRLKFPSVVQDSLLGSTFLHTYIPHYVWIGIQGEVLSFTERTVLTSHTIHTAYHDGIVNAPVKDDSPLVEMDYDRPLYENSALAGRVPIYHATLSGYAEGLTGRYHIGIDTVTDRGVKFGNKLTCTNQSILWLFNVAYSAGGFPFDVRSNIRIDVADPSRITTTKSGMEYLQWLEEGNGYCYELIVPEDQKDSLFSFMRQDLRRLFPQYQAKIEEEKTEAYTLTVADAAILTKSTGNQPMAVEVNEFGLTAVDAAIGRIVNRLNSSKLLPLTVVNRTDFREKIDICITADMRDIDAVNVELAKHGLKLEVGYRSRRTLVISDNI